MCFLTCLLLFASGLWARSFETRRIPNEAFPGKMVEVFWKAPQGNGPFPLLIFAHPYQGKSHPGAIMLAQQGALEAMSRSGFIGVAFSHAGNGKTDGHPDNAGPVSQGALRSVIRHFRNLPISSGQVYLYGISLGATLSAVVATQEKGLTGVILENGAYDVEALLHQLWFQARADTDLLELYQELEHQTGADPGRFRTRSALERVKDLSAPVLILAGLGDTVTLPDYALRLHQAIRAHGGDSELVIFPFSGHAIAHEKKIPHFNRFFSRTKKLSKKLPRL